MTNYVRVQTPNVFESQSRPPVFDVPVFSSNDSGVQVSSRWSPAAQIAIRKIEVSMSLSMGISTFAILKGFNNNSVDPNNPFDVLMLGGDVACWLRTSAYKSQTLFSNYEGLPIYVAPSEWIAVGCYEAANPCVNPSIRFYAELME
jgi:hypothetical protein